MADAEEQKLTDEQAELSAMFGATKKKKKVSSKKAAAGADAAAAPSSSAVEEGADAAKAAEGTSEGAKSSGVVSELDPPSYTYAQLLDRVVGFVHQNNPELVDKKRSTMKPPQLSRGEANCTYVVFASVFYPSLSFLF